MLLRRAVKGAVCKVCPRKRAVKRCCSGDALLRTRPVQNCCFGGVLLEACCFRHAISPVLFHSMLLRAFRVVLLHRAVSENLQDVRQRLVLRKRAACWVWRDAARRDVGQRGSSSENLLERKVF